MLKTNTRSDIFSSIDAYDDAQYYVNRFLILPDERKTNLSKNCFAN